MPTLSDDAVAHLLDRWPVARLATVGSDGAPHLVPIVFARVGDRLWSAIDGKPKGAGEPARVRNVRRDPRTTLLLDEYTDDWRALWWIRVSARARVVHDRTPDAGDVAVAIAALRAKYPQYRQVAVVRDPATLLVFDVIRVRSWCASAAAVPAPAGPLGRA